MKASAQCRVRVTEGGGEILPTEAVHFTRKEIKDNWRLALMVTVTIPELTR